jgi:hypothetical protein
MKAGDLVRSKGGEASGWVTGEHPLYDDAVWVNWFDGAMGGCALPSPGQETLVYKENLELVST